MFPEQQTLDAAHDMGTFLDELPGMGTSGAVSTAFVAFTKTLWDQGIALLESAINQPTGYFVQDR